MTPHTFHRHFAPWAISLVFCTLTLTGCGFLPRPKGLARFPKGTPATLAKLNQVQMGMTVAQVEAIFGKPGHTSQGSSRENPPFLSWTNENLTGAIVMFKNGRATQRMAVGGLK